jgi:hypothetical protein
MKYLFAPAYTTNDFDNADFVLVKIKPELIDVIKKTSEAAKHLSNELGNGSFNRICVWNDHHSFYTDEEINETLDEIIGRLEEGGVEIVDLPEIPDDLLQEPEVNLGAWQLRVDEDSVVFIAYSHSGDEYRSEPIPVQTFLDMQF